MSRTPFLTGNICWQVLWNLPIPLTEHFIPSKLAKTGNILIKHENWFQIAYLKSMIFTHNGLQNDLYSHGSDLLFPNSLHILHFVVSCRFLSDLIIHILITWTTFIMIYMHALKLKISSRIKGIQLAPVRCSIRMFYYDRYAFSIKFY